MRFDVKSIAQKHEKEFEVFSATTKDVDLLILKGHLLVEQFLTSLIESYCFKPSFLEDAKLTFFNKVKLARCFVMHPMPDDSIWDNIEYLNRLRNEITHKWKTEKKEKLIRDFLIYRAKEHKKIDPNTIDLSTNEKCAEEISCSMSWLIGQLSILDIVIKFMESQKTYGQQKTEENSK
jgi:hypothetical protein